MFTEQQMIIIAKYAILHGYEKTKQVFFVSHSTVAKAVKLLDEIEPNFKIDRKNVEKKEKTQSYKYKWE